MSKLLQERSRWEKKQLQPAQRSLFVGEHERSERVSKEFKCYCRATEDIKKISQLIITIFRADRDREERLTCLKKSLLETEKISEDPTSIICSFLLGNGETVLFKKYRRKFLTYYDGEV